MNSKDNTTNLDAGAVGVGTWTTSTLIPEPCRSCGTKGYINSTASTLRQALQEMARDVAQLLGELARMPMYDGAGELGPQCPSCCADFTERAEHIVGCKLKRIHDHARALLTPSGTAPEPNALRQGWLIESASPQGVPQYWDGHRNNSFTIDHNDAVRFARFDDAERVRAWMLHEPIRDHCRSVLHMWAQEAIPRLPRPQDEQAQATRIPAQGEVIATLRDQVAMAHEQLQELDDMQASLRQALQDLWIWATEARIDRITDPVPEGLGQQVIAALEKNGAEEP